MATIKKGTYRFNDVLDVPHPYSSYYAEIPCSATSYLDGVGNVKIIGKGFFWNDVDDPVLSYIRFGTVIVSTEPDLSDYGFAPDTVLYLYDDVDGWVVDTKTVDILEDTEVSAEFAEWFTANTKLVGGDAVTIEYNGNVIASFTHGTKAIRCNGAVMQGDVVVNVPEMGGGGGVDLAGDTVTEADVLSGVTFHKADGTQAEGTIEHYVPEKRFPNSRAKPKAYFPKPTQAQIDGFVDGEIAYVPRDAENLYGICNCTYMHQEVADGVYFTAVYLRGKAESIISNSRIAWYYVWDEDIPVAKVLLESMGINTDAVTTGGWYTILDTFVAIPAVLNEIEAFHEMFRFFHPYNEYFYSMFDWYAYDGSKAVMLQGSYSASSGYWDEAGNIATAGRYCDDSIVIGRNAYRSFTNNGEGYGDVNEAERRRFVGLTYIDLEVISSETTNVIVERYAYKINGDRFVFREGQFWTGTHSIVYSSLPYGIKIIPADGKKMSKIHTNATLVSQSADEAYITGLKEDTHIVVVMDDGSGGAKKYNINWDTSGLKAHGYYGIFSLPETVYEGQTVTGVVAYSWDTEIEATGCTITTKIGGVDTIRVNHLEDYKERSPAGTGFSGNLCIIEISNPTGDVSIGFTQSGGGSN